MQSSGDTGLLFRQFVGALRNRCGFVSPRKNRDAVTTLIFQCRRPLDSGKHHPNVRERGADLRRDGSRHSYVAPAEIFPCKDGHVFLYVSRRDWKDFLEVWVDHPAELEGADWMDNGFRRAHAERFTDKVAEFTSRFKKNELTKLLQSRGINCLPVNRPREFLANGHIARRGFCVKAEQRVEGTLSYLGAPFIINGCRPKVRPAPSAGEHQAS